MSSESGRTGLVRVLLFIVCSWIVLASLAPLARSIPGHWQELALGASAAMAMLILTVVFVRWEGLHLRDVGAALGARSLMRFAAGFGIGLALAGAQSGIAGLSGHVRLVRAPQTGTGVAGVTLLAYVALACREELAFRGYPLRNLDRLFGPVIAQLAVASLFAVEHLMSGYPWHIAILGTGTGALLFGIAALATRGLAMPIGLHAAWNFGQWVLGGKLSPGIWQAIVEPEFQAQVDRLGMVGYLVVMWLAVGMFWVWYRRRARTA